MLGTATSVSMVASLVIHQAARPHPQGFQILPTSLALFLPELDKKGVGFPDHDEISDNWHSLLGSVREHISSV